MTSKIHIPAEQLDFNLTFYFFLKHLVKSKMTDRQVQELISILKVSANPLNSIEIFRDKLAKSEDKLREYDNLLGQLNEQNTTLFLFALRLYQIKPLLLADAKAGYIAKTHEIDNFALLSLNYDKNSLLLPYTMRVNGALLALIFFGKLEAGEINLLSKTSENLLLGLSEQAQQLKRQGLEPNQIFMLMFNESINQSITSSSGSNYEDRILKTLVDIGIPLNDIKTQTHDKEDKSTEYDFFFTLEGKTFGIGAKKTLRERYKQFIKTALTSKVDVSIEITLGLDLNEGKAETIRSHDTIIFVAEEVYNERPFLQQMQGVYSTADFSLSTLIQIANHQFK